MSLNTISGVILIAEVWWKVHELSDMSKYYAAQKQYFGYVLNVVANKAAVSNLKC